MHQWQLLTRGRRSNSPSRTVRSGRFGGMDGMNTIISGRCRCGEIVYEFTARESIVLSVAIAAAACASTRRSTMCTTPRLTMSLVPLMVLWIIQTNSARISLYLFQELRNGRRFPRVLSATRSSFTGLCQRRLLAVSSHQGISRYNDG